MWVSWGLMGMSLNFSGWNFDGFKFAAVKNKRFWILRIKKCGFRALNNSRFLIFVVTKIPSSNFLLKPICSNFGFPKLNFFYIFRIISVALNFKKFYFRAKYDQFWILRLKNHQCWIWKKKWPIFYFALKNYQHWTSKKIFLILHKKITDLEFKND